MSINDSKLDIKNEMDTDYNISPNSEEINKHENNYKNKNATHEMEILDNKNSDKNKGFREEIISMMKGSFIGPTISPLDSKLNEKHIDKILEIKEKYDDRIFKDTQQSRRYSLLYFTIGVSLFIFLTLFLVGKDTELFKELIKILGTFAGGFGVGYGVKTYFGNK